MLIKKEYLLSLIKALQYDTTPQKFRQKRVVTKALAAAYQELEKDRIDLCHRLCDKKEDGKPELTEEGHFKFTNEKNKNEFLKEVAILTNETVEIETTKEQLEHFIFEESTINMTNQENEILVKMLENLV